MIGNFRKKMPCFLRLLWYDKIKTMYIYIYLSIYILFHHHYHQICFIWLNREILFQAVIIFHWVLEEVCFVSTNPWPLKLQVGITLLIFEFSDKPNCTSSRFFFNFNSRKSFNFIVFGDRVCVFYSLTLQLFEKYQRVKDILVPPKCLLLFQKK